MVTPSSSATRYQFTLSVPSRTTPAPISVVAVSLENIAGTLEERGRAGCGPPPGPVMKMPPPEESCVRLLGIDRYGRRDGDHRDTPAGAARRTCCAAPGAGRARAAAARTPACGRVALARAARGARRRRPPRLALRLPRPGPQGRDRADGRRAAAAAGGGEDHARRDRRQGDHQPLGEAAGSRRVAVARRWGAHRQEPG